MKLDLEVKSRRVGGATASSVEVKNDRGQALAISGYLAQKKEVIKLCKKINERISDDQIKVEQ